MPPSVAKEVVLVGRGMRTWRRCGGWRGFGGERERVIVTRAGRHFAIHGDLVADEAHRRRGDMDFLSSEVLEAIDSRFARVLTTRREALDLHLQEGVITVAEARQDV